MGVLQQAAGENFSDASLQESIVLLWLPIAQIIPPGKEKLKKFKKIKVLTNGAALIHL
jgi:hypothetical protein